MNAAAKLEDASEFRVDWTVFVKTDRSRYSQPKAYKSEVFGTHAEALEVINSLPEGTNYCLMFRTPELKIFKPSSGNKITAGA